MKSFASSAVINAAPERVWSVLTEGERYPAWNTTVEKLEGRISLGETIKLHVKINPGRAFPVKVTILEAPRRMVWTGGMPLGREQFTDPLSPIFGRMIPDLQPAFDEFAQALKREAERA